MNISITELREIARNADLQVMDLNGTRAQITSKIRNIASIITGTTSVEETTNIFNEGFTMQTDNVAYGMNNLSNYLRAKADDAEAKALALSQSIEDTFVTLGK